MPLECAGGAAFRCRDYYQRSFTRAGDRRRLRPVAAREETGDEIDGKRKTTVVLFGANLGQRLQVAKLDAKRILIDDRRRLSEL